MAFARCPKATDCRQFELRRGLSVRRSAIHSCKGLLLQQGCCCETAACCLLPATHQPLADHFSLLCCRAPFQPPFLATCMHPPPRCAAPPCWRLANGTTPTWMVMK